MRSAALAQVPLPPRPRPQPHSPFTQLPLALATRSSMGTWADSARGPRLLGRLPRLVPAWHGHGKPLGSRPRGGESDARPEGEGPRGGVTLCLGQHWALGNQLWGRGSCPSWVRPQLGASHRLIGPVPGARERGRVPRARLSGMPAPTCSFLSSRVDTLRDGRGSHFGRWSIKESSENLVPSLLPFSPWSIRICLT